METTLVLSFLGANLLAVLGLLAKSFMSNRQGNRNSNPSLKVLDTKLDTIIECANNMSAKVDSLSSVLHEIKGKLSG